MPRSASSSASRETLLAAVAAHRAEADALRRENIALQRKVERLEKQLADLAEGLKILKPGNPRTS